MNEKGNTIQMQHAYPNFIIISVCMLILYGGVSIFCQFMSNWSCEIFLYIPWFFAVIYFVDQIC